MSPVRFIRSRLREERGMTLIEVLVATLLGMIVMVAAINLMDASTRASHEVVNRMDGFQKGRSTMEQITQKLRTQTCPDKATPAIADATSTSISFYSELSGANANGNVTFSPEGRRISLAGGLVKEEVWNTLANPYANTFAGAPSTTRTLADAIYPQAGKPFFRYWTFLGNPGTPALELTPPLSAADRARVVKVDVAFDSRPSTLAAQSNRIDTSFENEIFVRTADPTDPEHSPLCD